MSVIGETTKAIRMTLVLWVLTAIIYPILVLAIAQVVFPYQANGSLVPNLEGKLIGSALIGQAFTTEPYFSSRPSTSNYSQGKEATPTGLSSASNLAPSNPDLLKRIQAEVDRLQEINVQPPTADLVYTSGSSLDPHISVASAIAQLEKVATARNLSTEDIAPLIVKHTQGRFLGIFGEPGVNVLSLNRELDILAFSRQQK
ncbi:K(+)-transporting ATPase subunit C [Chlorogloea sp. CCALA 695]|uniref:K(+)-transporting ATPase subunit C n=1 Tax=Chlorogloea sp. CCALA 695 TaxID=2107693 RepID=UPI000D0533B5|nr:K(+)-transporting ATPase subunit C [Chlorogloea sp. CCALA 695]PSB30958.1 K(+)-transporting ATPase subunit C [Chlorogloea sp. CCALA 695]